MSRYEVIGIPLGASVVAGQKVGDVIELDLEKDEEKALTGAGAIRKLPEPRKQEPKRAAPGKQNS